MFKDVLSSRVIFSFSIAVVTPRRSHNAKRFKYIKTTATAAAAATATTTAAATTTTTTTVTLPSGLTSLFCSEGVLAS